ncbi:ubiquitin carboxyl-terminal hydrolase [Ceratobasidium sp. AG-Ba]|nr:ubiquitin carboxyl-terminal hydrolase [Ceratobasidium sp. AG-Ba]QRW12104.1 ubiquitin carboxyl-terminal hydrolase [Ceratobasidium sp. AG-Ba]
MSAFTVHIKHGGKQQSLQLDPEQPPSVFKESIYQVTGVPVDRMKVMIKGSLLKDDTTWKGVNPKAGQTFMVIGTAGELPKPPSTPVQFMEDMDETELANALSMPVGLQNLGNTCYMNSTVQALRAIPELQAALEPAPSGPSNPQRRLAIAVRDTYKAMGKTTEGFPPLSLLHNLRAVFPQFAEQSNTGHFAQQDAEECWSQLVNTIKTQVPGLSDGAGAAAKSFVEQYMMGEIRTVQKSLEDPEEPEKVTTEGMLKINCNITVSTNYMHTGIKESLDEEIEKHSERLGRTAKYQQTSRISRLPSNLTVHMVRFYWRREINRKAKIMRKVKFPFELDVLDLLTDELRAKLQPATRKLREIEGERLERRRARRKLKNTSASTGQASTSASAPADGNDAMVVDEPRPGDIEDEATARAREKVALDEVIDPEVKADTGAAVHALFDLAAIVTHKGASADGGHYIGWVRKSALEPAGKENENAPEGDKEEWYKFDDDKVSVVTREKISTLDGGGEDSTAYILLYRAKNIY